MVRPTLRSFCHPCLRFMVHSAIKITSFRWNSALFYGATQLIVANDLPVVCLVIYNLRHMYQVSLVNF